MESININGVEYVEKLRELAMDMNSTEIISHTRLTPPYLLDGDWLDSWHRAFDKACDEIEREIAERYMELPVDRNGETWRIGDTFPLAGIDGKAHICTVSGVSGSEVFFYYDNHRDSSKHRHVTSETVAHRKRTIEDVLRDCCNEWNKHAGNDWESGVYAKYADELRGMGVSE